MQYNADDLPQLLRYYYANLFPYELFYKWLSYGEVVPDYFKRREFSFTLDGDIYLRYQSFADAEDMKRALVSKNPVKMDVGAVFNIEPKDSKKNELTAFQALERELIFDIDLTDYDDIRTCCKGAEICSKCWRFMIIAVKILDRALKDDFGFKHLLFVYSGRRGIHCWVSDQRARKLTFEMRSAIVEYLTLVVGGDFKQKKVHLNGWQALHPSVQSAKLIIDQQFPVLLEEQGWLDSEEKFERLLEFCPLNKVKAMLRQENIYNPKLKPSELWTKIESRVAALTKKDNLNSHFLDEFKLQHAYPRLDVNVSKGLNHLLKSPFSVHPKTGRVSVPIDAHQIENFVPENVPNISQIVSEVDEFDKRMGESKLEKYEKTSLKSSIVRFSRFINNLVQDNKQMRNKLSDETMEF